MSVTHELPRDVFIDCVHQAAQRDKNIYFLSADLGAKALDRFRAERNGQFIHAGICEQNMIDVAAGLALEGKIVYVYAMAPFVTLRCYEQIKVALASMALPVTIIGVGVGYSYDDAGPTHYATEDLSCMRALGGIEIVTPCDTQSVTITAHVTYTQPALRYVRLDRVFLPSVYLPNDTRFLADGMAEIEHGDQVCLITTGYMVHRALEVSKALQGAGYRIGVVDLYRIKPIDVSVLRRVVERYECIVTLEEHFLSGGLGSAVLEACADAGISRSILRLGIPDQYRFENGGRDYLHRLVGLDVPSLTARIAEFLSRTE